MDEKYKNSIAGKWVEARIKALKNTAPKLIYDKVAAEIRDVPDIKITRRTAPDIEYDLYLTFPEFHALCKWGMETFEEERLPGIGEIYETHICAKCMDNDNVMRPAHNEYPFLDFSKAVKGWVTKLRIEQGFKKTRYIDRFFNVYFEKDDQGPNPVLVVPIKEEAEEGEPGEVNPTAKQHTDIMEMQPVGTGKNFRKLKKENEVLAQTVRDQEEEKIHGGEPATGISIFQDQLNQKDLLIQELESARHRWGQSQATTIRHLEKENETLAQTVRDQEKEIKYQPHKDPPKTIFPYPVRFRAPQPGHRPPCCPCCDKDMVWNWVWKCDPCGLRISQEEE